MYHIKADKRSAKSAQLICDGLSQVLKKKTYINITISDVCSFHDIARSTFYRLFDTLDDVLLYQFDSLFQNSLNEFAHSDESYAKIILRIAVSDMALINALISSGRTDLFDFSTRNIEDDLIHHMHLSIDAKDRLYCTPMLNSMICSVIKTWLSNGCRETVSELYELIKKDLQLLINYM